MPLHTSFCIYKNSVFYTTTNTILVYLYIFVDKQNILNLGLISRYTHTLFHPLHTLLYTIISWHTLLKHVTISLVMGKPYSY